MIKKMRTKTFLRSLILGVLLANAVTASEGKDRPNIVIIYGDDVGYGDVGVYGSKKIPTPNIDQLAAEGIQFTDGHCTAATCTPSRYSMLTGMYGFREGVDILAPGAPLCLPTDKITLPKMLKKAGYHTAVIGKWHMGLGEAGVETNWNGEVKPGPLEVGFDHSYLLPVTNDRVPCVYLEGHRVVNLDPKDPLYITARPQPPLEFNGTSYPIGRRDKSSQTYGLADNQHASTVINGIARIGYQWGGKSALWNDETMADHFVDQAKKYIASKRNKPFFLYFASQDIHVPRAPHPRFQGKTGLGKRGDAMVQFDWTTGEIMKALEENGLTENTIVIFSSDNGPVYDDGYADGSEIKKSRGEVDNGHDGSGPYSGGKYQIYEGGTRVPMIVRWPARIKSGVSKALVSHVDFIASFAKLLGVDLAHHEAVDSRDNLAALMGEDPIGLPYMPQEAPGALGLRRGNWKYIEFKGESWAHTKGHARELYQLGDDIAENNNLIEEKPEVAKEMAELLKKIVDGGRIRE
jgi:arylsulfatase A-like enzyme